MSRTGPELPGSGRSDRTTNHAGAQQKTGHNRYHPNRRIGNPLVAGSSPAHPTSETVENLPRLACSFLLRRGMAGGGDLPERRTGRSSRDVTATVHRRSMGLMTLTGAGLDWASEKMTHI